MDDSSSDTTTAPPGFDWSGSGRAQEISLELRAPRREYFYFKKFDLKKIKEAWPCGDTGYTKQDQENLLKDLKRFYNQPHREDGDYVIVTETYRPPMKSGFPGRLNSSGCQGLVRALRSNILKDTADLDMNNAQPRVVVWACKQWRIPCPQFEFYINNRDGLNGMLQRIMDETSLSKGKAKQSPIITLTSRKKLRTSSPYLKNLDAEAKEIQKALMARVELQWILPSCKDDNKAGSFMSHLYFFIESQLLMRVYRMLVDEFGLSVALLVFDGLNITDKSKHGDQAILDRARAVCEEIAPGINMPWAWKELDFALESNEKKPLTNTDGSIKELRVPDSYTPPAPRSGADQVSLATDGTQPTYEELCAIFSLNNGDNPSLGHGKVGCEYIEVDSEGVLHLYDTAHFKAKHRDMVYFAVEDDKDEKGVVVGEKIEEHPFVDKWMNDKFMRAMYLPQDKKTQKYCWERFDMFPDAAECPDDVYNLWKGFAAEKMTIDDPERARDGLSAILEHFKMLVDGNVEQYDFMLNLLAHAIQHPKEKLGIMLCLVGKQGTGKERVWNVIQRVWGTDVCFATEEPDKDIWGDNNAKMKDASFVRLVESNKKQFKDNIGKLRNKLTDNPIRVRELYCKAANVKNYSRFFGDSNDLDAYPDEHGERRLFIIKCSEERIGDAEYFAKLIDVIGDENAIRAFYEFLRDRKIKKMYLGKDIPVGEFQKKLKDHNRSDQEHFVKWFVAKQDAGAHQLRFLDDAITDAYAEFRGGGEAENNKRSILRHLELGSIDGIKKEHATREYVEVGDELHWKAQWKTYYHFDMDELRKRYGFVDEDGEAVAPAAPVAVVDCGADVAMWERVKEADMEAAVAAAEAAAAAKAEAAAEDVEEQVVEEMSDLDEEEYDGGVFEGDEEAEREMEQQLSANKRPRENGAR